MAEAPSLSDEPIEVGRPYPYLPPPSELKLNWPLLSEYGVLLRLINCSAVWYIYGFVAV